MRNPLTIILLTLGTMLQAQTWDIEQYNDSLRFLHENSSQAALSPEGKLKINHVQVKALAGKGGLLFVDALGNVGVKRQEDTIKIPYVNVTNMLKIGTSSLWLGNVSGGETQDIYNTSGDIILQNNTLSTGFVGIGTPTPRAMLDVDGEVWANNYKFSDGSDLITRIQSEFNLTPTSTDGCVGQDQCSDPANVVIKINHPIDATHLDFTRSITFNLPELINNNNDEVELEKIMFKLNKSSFHPGQVSNLYIPVWIDIYTIDKAGTSTQLLTEKLNTYTDFINFVDIIKVIDVNKVSSKIRVDILCKGTCYSDPEIGCINQTTFGFSLDFMPLQKIDRNLFVDNLLAKNAKVDDLTAKKAIFDDIIAKQATIDDLKIKNNIELTGDLIKGGKKIDFNALWNYSENNGLYYNAENDATKRVGIGTASPVGVLHLRKSDDWPAILIESPTINQDDSYADITFADPVVSSTECRNFIIRSKHKPSLEGRSLFFWAVQGGSFVFHNGPVGIGNDWHSNQDLSGLNSKLIVSGNVFCNGRVGIGTNDYEKAVFTIKGSTLIRANTMHLSFGDENSTNYGQWTMEYWNGGLNFASLNSSNYYDNYKFFIKNDGKVGIGTNIFDADDLLTVNGKISCEQIEVRVVGDATADFVFEKDYNLLNLKEVEYFIQKNKHLPDVPSAENMKEDGIDIAKMNAILLQKIEELTLYTINQQKMIDELIFEVEKLKLK